VNADMIPALGSPVEGALYQFTDPVPYAAGEVWSYLLVETEFSGTTNTYGPALFPASGGLGETRTEDWRLH
jgi:hypothetical protein